MSFASRSLSSILRPLMPPCSLHHLVNASAVSNSSWLSPSRPEKPGSENVDTWIESAVTPGSVPAAFSSSAGAGQQTTPRSPKAPWSRPGLPAFAAVVSELGADVAVDPAVVSFSRPQAAAMRSAASVRINRRFDMVEHLRVRSRGIPNRPRDRRNQSRSCSLGVGKRSTLRNAGNARAQLRATASVAAPPSTTAPAGPRI